MVKYWTVSLATGLASCFLVLFPSSRKRKGAACVLTSLCLLTFALGCGGGGSSSPSVTGGGGGSGGSTGGTPPVPTSITLTTSNGKAPQNQSFVITAAVTSSKPLTGNITFYNFGNSVVTFPIANGQAQFGAGYLNNPGLYQVTASYSGDASNQPSTSAALTQVITGTFPGTLVARTGGDIRSLQINFGVQ